MGASLSCCADQPVQRAPAPAGTTTTTAPASTAAGEAAHERGREKGADTAVTNTELEMLKMQCLRSSMLGECLKASELQYLSTLCQYSKHPAFSVLCQREQPADTVYLVVKGEVLLSVEEPQLENFQQQYNQSLESLTAPPSQPSTPPRSSASHRSSHKEQRAAQPPITHPLGQSRALALALDAQMKVEKELGNKRTKKGESEQTDGAAADGEAAGARLSAPTGSHTPPVANSKPNSRRTTLNTQDAASNTTVLVHNPSSSANSRRHTGQNVAGLLESAQKEAELRQSRRGTGTAPLQVNSDTLSPPPPADSPAMMEDPLLQLPASSPLSDGLSTPPNRSRPVSAQLRPEAAKTNPHVLNVCVKDNNRLFGIETLIGPVNKYTYTATTNLPSTVLLTISQKSFNKFFKRYPALKETVLHHLGQYLYEALSRTSWLSSLSKPSLTLFTSLFHSHSVAANVILFEEGDVATDENSLFFLVEGSIELTITDEKGAQVKKTINKGSLFGELSIVCGFAITASAMTLTPCVFRMCKRRWISLFSILHPPLLPSVRAHFLSAYRLPDAQLLSHPSVQHCFSLFCAKEYNAENIEFFLEAIAFRKNASNYSTVELIHLANEIYVKFITETAILQINIKQAVRVKIREALEAGDIGKDLFVAAEKEILQLMLQDTFPRFKNSDLYRTSLNFLRAPPPAAILVGQKNTSSAALPRNHISPMHRPAAIPAPRSMQYALAGSTTSLFRHDDVDLPLMFGGSKQVGTMHLTREVSDGSETSPIFYRKETDDDLTVEAFQLTAQPGMNRFHLPVSHPSAGKYKSSAISRSVSPNSSPRTHHNMRISTKPKDGTTATPPRSARQHSQQQQVSAGTAETSQPEQRVTAAAAADGGEASPEAPSLDVIVTPAPTADSEAVVQQPATDSAADGKWVQLPGVPDKSAEEQETEAAVHDKEANID